MAFLERDQDHAVIDADRRAVAEGEIVVARRQADIVDDQLALVLRNDLADLVLDRLEDLLGLLDAGAGRRAHVQLDLAAVDDREEVAADEQEQRAAERQHYGRDHRHDDPASKQRIQHLPIAIAHGLEAALEAGDESAQTSRACRRRRVARP